MEHDDILQGTILNRRQVIAMASRAGLALATGAAASRAALASRAPAGPVVDLIASPALTQGPFYVNERLNRSDLRAGSTRPSIVHATPLRLNFTIYAGANASRFAPLPGARVDVWHVDALGVYSDEPQGLNPEDTEGQHWLRGYQITNSEGQVHFDTVFPGWYHGRTTHIHFKVHYLRDGKARATFTSQFFVPDGFADNVYQAAPYVARAPEEMHNAGDPVYRGTLRDGTKVGRIMTLVPRPTAHVSGYVADYAIAIVTHPHPSNGGHIRTSTP